MQFGLLGEKLSHSFSPKIHKHLADYKYDLYEVLQENLSAFIKSGDYNGLNVTIPYKKDVVPYCDELSSVAKELGSVNTLLRRPDGSLYGHNTDYFGFSYMIKQSGLDVTGKKVLILGSGGASVTVNAVLKHAGANTIIISRTGNDNYENVSKHYDADIIVNTTPVGMYPDTDASPISLDGFTKLEGVLDLIYNPANTKLLTDAQRRGAVTLNGLWMLVAQAKESAELFTGIQIPDDVIENIYSILSKESVNIVLIGMPGSGKTTIGKILSEILNKEFIDTDAEIVAQSGMTIPEIFARYGEARFRELESDVLNQYGKQHGLILATGGGCVTVSDHYHALHQNGIIIWLKRDVAALSTDGRPLSIGRNLSEMLAERKPMYEAFADFCVDNNTDPQITADTIRAIIYKEPK